ncbi:AfsR/SARP family transcriptional regulator [Nonomuraea typhae]|uniref:AfsR/SARP family transcriptional regulator n=1 Tax=Nonomuraea typhae TaxID=2603600 RepID=UPI0015E1D36C|nr:AfsR/SARP family transcriptional regulator [Nonomuraea typhae]
MRVLFLGPVEVQGDTDKVNLGGAKLKALLAALTLLPRQVVSIERLIDLIWDESPPRSATALVHTYVSSLRREFASIGRQAVLLTRSPGYLLDIEPDESDLEVHGQYLGLARQSERLNDYAEAVQHYEQALGLWRGPAFGGVDAKFARARAIALEEDLLTVEEGLARCDLALGRPSEGAARLARLTAEHPLREEARALLMRALYESGRPADALAAYRDGRRHLLDELGVEPGEKLRELHGRILSGTLDPLAPAARVTAKARSVHSTGQGTAVLDQYAVPRHLPPDIGDFIGRTEQLDSLRRLTERAAGACLTATPTVVISGFGGVGKSALAVHAAHLLRGNYADGQLFADLRGVDQDLGVRHVLGRFLSALGVHRAEQPDTSEDRVELYRRRVAGKSLVIVLDNVSSEHQVRKLLPGSPGWLVIITSRSRLTGLEGAELVELDYFSVDSSLEMISKIIGAERLAADPVAAATIAQLCGGIPLALRAAAAKLLARPHWPLQALATRLSDERRRLAELAVGDLAITSSLGLNYAELDDLHRRAFHLLTLLDLPDFGSWLAAPLLDVPLDDAEDVVEHLVDLRLLDVAGVDAIGRVRYRFHDLVQLYGAEQARHEPMHEALHRMLNTWRALVEVGAGQMPRVTLGLRRLPAAKAELDSRLRDEVEGNPSGWFKSETAAVVRAVERAHELGADGMTMLLIASLLSSPFAVRNEFDSWQRTLDVALSAAKNSTDPGYEAMILAGLGQLYYEKDEFAEAMRHYRQAWRQAEAVGDAATQAVALVGLGAVHRDLGELDQAVEELSAAAAFAEQAGDRDTAAAALYGLAAISRDTGDVAAAATSLETCMRLYQELGDKRGEALSLRGLSLCHRARGEAEQAAELSRCAELILDEAGDPLGAGYARQSRAKAMIRSGRTAEASELLDSCMRVFTEQRDRFGLALATRTLGELALARGDDVSARELLSDALSLWSELGLPLWQARTLRDLAAAGAISDAEAAGRHWSRAISMFTALGAREAVELARIDPRAWLDHVRLP